MIMERQLNQRLTRKNTKSSYEKHDRTQSNGTSTHKRFIRRGLPALIVVSLIAFSLSKSMRETRERIFKSRSKRINQARLSIIEDEKDYERITKIALIGERNSGTNWMFDHLVDCFNGTDLLHVSDHLTRGKHWFQHYSEKKRYETTFVVSQYRNPYHWILAMMSLPHHAIDHQFLDWRTFVTKPWTTKRAGLDLNLTQEQKLNCKQDFTFDEVISCTRIQHPEDYYYQNIQKTRFSGKRPFYELKPDGSGIPYASIIHMRADKIRNHLQTELYPFVKNFLQVKYEDLVEQGTAFVLQEIEGATGIKADCTAYPPQPGRVQRDIPKDFRDWMNTYADWEAEALIGYEKLTD